MGQVAESESIPNEEKMENPEEFEGFENEEFAEEKPRTRSSRVYSPEEVPEGKTRGQ